MNEVQRAALDVAKATGRVDDLFEELCRQIDRLLDGPFVEREDVVSRVEHERVVRKLNQRIVELTTQLRKAS